MTSLLFIESLFAFVWAVVICSFSIPPIIHLSFRKKLLDIPNERRLHQESTPRLGGLAIFAGFTSAVAIFGDFAQPGYAIQQIFAGMLLLFFAGVKDDLAPITAFKKFFVQLLATGIVIFVGGLRVTTLQGFLGIYEIQNIGLSYAFTFVMIIAITNAINLIDGLNGLAGSLVLLMSVFFGSFFYVDQSPMAVLCFATAGAMIGFLKYNLLDGRIFMGDSGSLVIGFLIAVFAVSFLESDLSEVSKTPQLCIAILVVPLFDTLRVFVTRIIQGKSPFEPDKNHIHHKLIEFGFSHLSALGVLLTFNLSLILAVYFMPKIEITLFVSLLVFAALVFSLVLRWIDYKRQVTT
jgi:UDP-GlcNAc:undecaprenyl-phosphate/decaprenyl-phosphate GlcNAc-1-phosphate transferase